jgi:ParB family chromosome partitioning protein
VTKESSLEAAIPIPVAEIRVVNSRTRNRIKWLEIVQSISLVGLKRPITVSRRSKPDEKGKLYDLVCGQGRLEAFMALDAENIPAIIVDAPPHDLQLMSLIENIARHPCSATLLLQEVRILHEQGCRNEEICAKLGMERSYIYGICQLIDSGEDFLIESVEKGRIPLHLAIQISVSKDHDVNRALSEAYETGELRGHHVAAARRVITQRITRHEREGKEKRVNRKLTGEALVHEYKEKIREQNLLVAKAGRTRDRLILLTSAVRTMLADENFRTLLRAEGMQDMPAELATRLQ